MAEQNIDDPTDVNRCETRTDASLTSIADGQDVGPPDSPGSHVTDSQHVGDGHDVGPSDIPETNVTETHPVVYVEPPITQTRPPIIYIPIPSPGDP